jgi:hypothetical protein
MACRYRLKLDLNFLQFKKQQLSRIFKAKMTARECAGTLQTQADLALREQS